jgi:hypothetical protein
VSSEGTVEKLMSEGTFEEFISNMACLVRANSRNL